MIYFEEQYIEFIRNRGVGAKDRVASSPMSYVSYLHSVSEILAQDITPAMLRSEQDIKNIVLKIDKQRASNTVRKYCSAMRQYVAFVEEKRL